MFEDLTFPKTQYANIILRNANNLKNSDLEMAPLQEYKKLWTDAMALITEDPLVKEYLADGKTLSRAFDLLKKHFEDMNQPDLANQIGNMKEMYKSLNNCFSNLNLAPDLMNNPKYYSGHSDISYFVKYLNLVNGIKPNQKNDPIDGEVAPSLLDQAYKFNKDNNYADVKTSPESFLVIRLGQICKDMMSKVSAIDAMGHLLESQNKELNKQTTADTYSDFIKKFEQDPEAFFAEADQKLPQLKDKAALYKKETETLENLETEEAWKHVTANEEYKAVLNKYYRANSVKAQDQAVEAAKKEHARKVQLQRETLNIVNETNKEHNAQALKDYQAELDYYEGQRQNLAEFQSDKAKTLKEIDDKLNPLKAERDKEQQAIDAEAQVIEKQWKEYNDKRNALEKKLNTVIKDSAEVANYSAVYAGPEIEKYHDFKEIRDDYNHVYDFLSTIAGEGLSHDERAAWINTALGSKHVTNEDLGNAALSGDKKIFENLQKVANIQNQWAVFTIDPENAKYKDIIKEVEKYYGTFKDVKDMGALDAVRHGIQVNQAKMDQLRNKPENAKYFEAQLKLGSIVSRYPGGKMPSDADIKAMQQELDSMQAPTDPAQWRKEKESELKTKYAEIDDLEFERKKETEQFDAAIKRTQDIIKEADNLKEPELRTVKTSEEIEAEVEKFDKANYNPEVEKQVKEAAFKGYIKEHHLEGVMTVQRHLDDSSRDVQHQIRDIELKQENINKLFEYDKAKTNSDSESLANINSALEKYNNEKTAYYQSVINDIDQYISNQEEGMKPGHKNTEEFKLMFTRMTEAKQTLQRMTGNGPKPDSAELAGAFSRIKEATDQYADKKRKGWHIGSTMHHARLKMAEQMGRFADEKGKALIEFEALGNKLVNDLNEMRPKENLRAVEPNATAKQHFTKMFKQAHPEMNAPKKQPPKPVSQLDPVKQEMEKEIKKAEQQQLKENDKPKLEKVDEIQTGPSFMK